MEKLTLAEARRLNDTMVTEEHLQLHAARMRPNGITDMDRKGFMKKWKNKKFAAKCNRPLILEGCEMLGMSIEEVAEICVEGMKAHAEELHLTADTLHTA